MRFLLPYLSLIPLLAALDLLWVGVLMKGFYTARVGHLMGESVNWWGALGFYLVFPAGILYFCSGAQNVGAAALAGGMLGLVTYATYNFTNLAVLKGWPLSVAAFDILWGTVLGALLGAASYWVLGFFIK